MKKICNKKYFVLIIVSAVLFVGIQMIYAINKEPGSQEDPIVTLSYVEQRIEQLKHYVEELIKKPKFNEEANYSIPSDIQATIEKLRNDVDVLIDENKVLKKAQELVVVELKAGQTMIGSQGTEIILRGGSAIAVDSPSGGLSDVTAARDIRNAEPIPPNHLLIIPREDGRGVKALVDAIFIVRGSYKIGE